MVEIQQPSFLFPLFFSETSILLSLLLKQDTAIDDKNSKLKQHAINILTRNQEKVLSSCRIPLAELVLQGYMHLLPNMHPLWISTPGKLLGKNAASLSILIQRSAGKRGDFPLTSTFGFSLQWTLLHRTDIRSLVPEHWAIAHTGIKAAGQQPRSARSCWRSR